MNNLNLLKGLLLLGISLFFGLRAPALSLGSWSKPGPGLFPLLVSVFLLLVALGILVRARLTEPRPADMRFRNIAMVSAGLAAFALLSEWINMSAGLIALVFLASLAGEDFSVSRSLKIIAVLGLIAVGMREGLGFRLPLY